LWKQKQAKYPAYNKEGKIKISSLNNKRNKGRGKDILQGLNLHPWNRDTRCHDHRFI